MHESMCNVVLTARGTGRVKEVKVIAHAIACRGRGFHITGVNCRRQLPVM